MSLLQVGGIFLSRFPLKWALGCPFFRKKSHFSQKWVSSVPFSLKREHSCPIFLEKRMLPVSRLTQKGATYTTHLEQISGVVDAKYFRLHHESCTSLLPPASASPFAPPLSMPCFARKSQVGLIHSSYLRFLRTMYHRFRFFRSSLKSGS